MPLRILQRFFSKPKILFVKNDRYLPELYGGVEVATHGMCQWLQKSGYRVAVAGLTHERPAVSESAGAAPVVVHNDLGYPVYLGTESLRDALVAALQAFKPSLVVAQEFDKSTWLSVGDLLGDAALLLYQHSVFKEARELYGEDSVRSRQKTAVVTNSMVTHDYFSECGVENVVVPPVFGIERHWGSRRSGSNVIMISIQRSKGTDIAVAIAAQRPQHHFVFVESWSSSVEETSELKDAIQKLPNTTLLSRVSDMGPIFASGRLLLMPSRCEEAWGRSASEAQLFGIPVLGSDRGNLVKTIGRGGHTLSPDADIGIWLEAFDRIMDDDAHFAGLSAAALANGRSLLRVVGSSKKAFLHTARTVLAA